MGSKRSNIEDSVYAIGRLGKIHGVKGEISFNFTDDIFDRTDADYVFLRVDGILVPFFIEEYRFRSDTTALIKFCDVDTEEQARALTGCEVFFPRGKQDDDGLMSWHELVGFTLIDQATGNTVGIIKGVNDDTANILFEVSTPEGNDLLLPAHEELITDVETESHTIRMNLPEGILDI